jgi:hypothetical protein
MGPTLANQSLVDRFVTLCTKPALPDLDILPTGSFTLQIGLTYPSHGPPDTSFPHGQSITSSDALAWHRTSAFLYLSP